MNISIPIPFSEKTMHFGTVWATLSSTDNDSKLSDARIGGLAMRVSEGNTVNSAAAIAMGGALADDSPVVETTTDDAVEVAVEAADDKVIEAGVKERVPADYQPTTGTKPSPKADPVTEDAPPVASDDFAGLSEAELMSMSFD